MARRELSTLRAALQVAAACLALGAGACGGETAEDQMIHTWEARCEGGELQVCVSLGYAYRDGSMVEQDTGRALALFQRACDGGETEGCVVLGSMYENGLWVGLDRQRGEALYQRACEGGDAEGCEALEVHRAVNEALEAPESRAPSEGSGREGVEVPH